MRIAVAGFGILFLLSIGLALPIVCGTTTQWSPEIRSQTYHWKAEKAELRDIEGDERYWEYSLLGGINVEGGDNAIRLRSVPTIYDLFAGDRLNISWTVEGDSGIFANNDSDIHLTLLPLSINETNTFELLFSEQETLELLTHSVFVNSTIETERAIAMLKYNDILDVVYEWDTSSGILTRKEVTAPSGRQLVVVSGEGWRFGALSPGLIILVITPVAFVSCIGLALRQKAKQ